MRQLPAADALLERILEKMRTDEARVVFSRAARTVRVHSLGGSQGEGEKGGG
jgi:hypothetical protein